MKIRYDDSFDYEINVPEQLMGETVPRLIIQPFVENALKYGINCPPPWKLMIIGEDAGDTWRVVVLDNGPGFTDKALSELEERMREAARQFEFEKAAALRDRLKALRALEVMTAAGAPLPSTQG